jgi:hypothetical protein
MTQRSDISNKLIHFTRGKTHDDAFATLWTIMNQGRLIGGNGMIRGGYSCVCFTEAPLPALSESFANPLSFTRYSPFGVMFDKSWVFAHGGLPVIYQPDRDFNTLNEEARWRHVRYELDRKSPIDFTWEREWRIHCKELVFTPSDAIIVVPDPIWVDQMLEMHKMEQDFRVELYSTVFSEDIVETFVEEFPWRIITLI